MVKSKIPKICLYCQGKGEYYLDGTVIKCKFCFNGIEPTEQEIEIYNYIESHYHCKTEDVINGTTIMPNTTKIILNKLELYDWIHYDVMRPSHSLSMTSEQAQEFVKPYNGWRVIDKHQIY